MVRAEFGDSLQGWLRRVKQGVSDLRPLARPLGQILLEGNRKGLGTDLHGNKLAPLSPNTKTKRRGGDGPPLAPRGLGSRIVTQAQIQAAGTGDYLVLTMDWDLPWLIHHVKGTKYMKQRDPVGIRPNTMDEIDAFLNRYWDNLLEFRQGTK